MPTDLPTDWHSHQESRLQRRTRRQGACDIKAATVKGHVRGYINEGHDVETDEEFKNAVLSHGGINGVGVALVDTVKCDISVEGK